MIRSTVNETSETVDRSVVSVGYELVLGGVDAGSAVTIELQESNPAPPAFTTTIPSNMHNGPKE